MRLDSRLRRRLGLALVATPVALQLVAVALLGVNTILGDEIFYVDFIRDVHEGRSWWHWLALQHNEHRVVPMKLVMAPLALLTHWDTRAEMYVSGVLAALTVLGLWHLYRRLGGEDLLFFAPAAWLVCSFAQYENMLWGMMMCLYFTVAGAVWALVMLAGGGPLALAGAVLCALTAAFSLVNGALIWPLGLALLLLQRRWRGAVVWSAIGGMALIAYFHGFQRPPAPHAEPPLFALSTVSKVGRFGVTLLGGSLAGGSNAWSKVIGLLLAAGAAWLAVRWVRSPQHLRREAPVAALLAFGALSCGMLAVGRLAFDEPPLQPRYVAYSTLVVLPLYLLLARAAERGEPALRIRLVFAAALALLLPGLAAANLDGLENALRWRQGELQQKLALQTFDQQPPEALGAISLDERLPAKAAYLRQHRLGPFADAMDMMLVGRWREGVPADEILPGRAVEQTLVCPVNELRDLGVPFITYARRNRSHVTLSLWADGHNLAAREVSAATLEDNGWVTLSPRLKGCRGKHLLVRIESVDASAGDALTVWTYPRYYDGEVRQPGNLRITGRSLGLTLNALSAGLISE